MPSEVAWSSILLKNSSVILDKGLWLIRCEYTLALTGVLSVIA